MNATKTVTRIYISADELQFARSFDFNTKCHVGARAGIASLGKDLA